MVKLIITLLLIASTTQAQWVGRTPRMGGGQDGLVLCYDNDVHGDHPWADKSGSGNHGTLYGPTWADSKADLGKCYDFGVVANSSIVCSRTSGDFSFDADEPFSISAYVLYKEYGDWQAPLTTVDSGDSNDQYILGTTWNDNNISAYFRAGGVFTELHSAKTMTTNIWYLVTMTRTSAGELALYTDGILLVISSSNNANACNPPVNMTIGKHRTSLSSSDNLKVDDVRFYKSCLTSNQVYDLYQGTAPTNSMVAYYDFEGNPNTTIKDVSAEHNDGTVYGATATGGAMSFNGVNNCVDSSTFTPVKDIGSGKPYSVALWVNQATASAAAYACLWQVDNITYRWYMFISATGNYYSGLYNSTHAFTTTATKGEWEFVVLVYTGMEQLLYVDGEYKETWAVGAKPYSDNYLRWGANTSGGQLFNGKLDDTRICNRALSAQEIYQLYIETKGTHSND